MTLDLAFRAAPWLAILALLGILAVQSDRIDGLKGKVETCQANRAADHAAYRAAQDRAKSDNLAHVRKVESEQRAKTDAVESRWNADRARLAELMRKGTPAPQGNTGRPGSPAVPGTAEGSDEEAAVCVPASGALSAAETELKLRHLQDWITEQLTLNPS